MALLTTENLGKTFDHVVAAKDINVAVEPGERIGIIGANGAGKTTFVNMITGYLKPTTGRILLGDKDITHLGPKEITALGVCRSFQVAQIFPTMTVEDNMAIALGLARRGKGALWRPLHTNELLADADLILERFRIQDYRDALASELPQGIRKLLDIAMAVAADPRVLLMDEPTSGISVEEKFGIMDVLMGALGGGERTILFVEHDMEIVERYARRVLAFYDGTVIADGPPAEALADPKVRQYIIGEVLHRRRPASLSPADQAAGAAGA